MLLHALPPISFFSCRPSWFCFSCVSFSWSDNWPCANCWSLPPPLGEEMRARGGGSIMLIIGSRNSLRGGGFWARILRRGGGGGLGSRSVGTFIY